MIWIGEWPLELKICLLDFLRNDFGEVGKATVQCVENPWEHILCFLCIEKNNLFEVA
jgi:hypothetical protein